VRDNFPGKRLLVAEDEAEIRELYQRVVARIGVDADIVSNGRDAITALKARKYDIALLDLNMRGLNGWEVLDYLRTRPAARPQRLFVVTGFAEQLISVADRELVAAVIYKPVASDELRELVAACLRGGVVDLASILRTTSHRVTPAA
jgi:CheY-like chemotaxis protein